ncbi:MAG: Glycine--tRNA ligase [Tenericutes bacterium ADurb.Bin239]|nr:MAG: Glycine--tRNA ligase [Tenericutes bacterium ADurb.Bin239]
MTLVDAYDEEELENDSRIVMRLAPHLAAYQVAVLPLQRKLSDKALEVFSDLVKEFSAVYDETGSIGKRYRRQDAIGTPYCVTIDFDTLADDTVTIRERDSMAQVRLPISDLKTYLDSKVKF